MKGVSTLFVLMVLTFSGCEKITDYYLGIPQQPELTETVNTNEFNIFGILRPDSIGGFNKSFIFVQRIWPALAYNMFSIINDAEVKINQIISEDSLVPIDFPLMAPDSFIWDTLYRPVGDFHPQPGERYNITCTHPDLNPAHGELIFPSEPRIAANSLVVEEGNISFVLEADSLIEMYDLYLNTSQGNFFIGREVSNEQEDTEVNLMTEFDLVGAKLKIFSYEKKLATYLGNSNTSLNFNKYREDITTLEKGFGVFGALNFIVVDL